jgi:MFS family permease
MIADSQPTYNKFHRIYPGWWMVLYAGLLSGLAIGFSAYGLSVFFKDLAAELSLSRAMTSAASGIGILGGVAVFPLSGWLSDKYGPRWLIFTGACAGALGLAAMYFINSATTYFLAWGVLFGIGIHFGLNIPIDQALTNWFVRKRGLATGLKFALIGVAGVATIPVVTWLVTGFGWRLTCLIWGIIMLLSTPLSLIIIKQKRPEYYGLLPDGDRVGAGTDTSRDKKINKGTEYASNLQETEFSFKQAIRTRRFWIIAAANGIFLGMSGGFTIHMIPFLTDMGIDKAVAAALMTMMVFFTIPTRLFGGIIADRISKGYLQFLLAGIFVLPVLGITTYLLSQGTVSLYVMLVAYGFSGGAVTPLVIVILGRYFGRKSFGSIFGGCLMIQAVASLLGPVYYGWIYDTTGNYTMALALFAVVAALCTATICLASAPRSPAGVS